LYLQVEFPFSGHETAYSVPIINKAKGPWSNKGDRVYDPAPEITKKNRDRRRKGQHTGEKLARKRQKLQIKSLLNSSDDEDSEESDLAMSVDLSAVSSPPSSSPRTESDVDTSLSYEMFVGEILPSSFACPLEFSLSDVRRFAYFSDSNFFSVLLTFPLMYPSTLLRTSFKAPTMALCLQPNLKPLTILPPILRPTPLST
jgi:hypothetical protein